MKSNILQILSTMGGKTPEGIVIAIIAAMACGAIPLSIPLAAIAASLAASGKILQYFEKKSLNIKHTKGQNPTIKINKNMMVLILAIPLASFMLQSCFANHPLLTPDSLKSTLEVASAYIAENCKSVAVYPGYEMDFGYSSEQDDTATVQHGFGGIIGGCGKFARISCQVITNHSSGRESVKCSKVGVLISEAQANQMTE